MTSSPAEKNSVRDSDTFTTGLSSRRERVLNLTAILSIPGIAFSSYLTLHHYDPRPGLCNINQVWNCDVVNRSSYSEIFGIPVALLGLLLNVAFLVLSLNGLGFFSLGWLGNSRWIIVLAAAASAAAMYLTYIEFFVLMTICPFCLMIAILTWTTLSLSLIFLR